MNESSFVVPPNVPSDRPSETRLARPRRAAPSDIVRPTRAEVNLEALRHNFRVVSRRAGTAAVWPVLKADGYGHGAPAVARTLERAGAQGFCVALVEEGVELREAGIVQPLLVMGGYYADAYEEVLHRGMTPVVYDASHLDGLARAVRATGKAPIRVHLKVDTGMARLGVRLKDLPAFAAKLVATEEVVVDGLMTHLASADAATADDVNEQLARFEEAERILRAAGITPRVRHAANSAATLREVARFDLVRPGIALFGVSPRPPIGAPFESELRPVMRVRTEVVALRTLEPGETVGYGGLFRASSPVTLATVAMGYADGLSRSLTNKGALLVRGKRAPIAGAVSMDMCMIDVTDHPGVALKDEVVVLGAQEGPLGKDTITADEVAGLTATIPWEVLTQVSRRVPRFYREP